jgi:hypothetical protein
MAAADHGAAICFSAKVVVEDIRRRSHRTLIATLQFGGDKVRSSGRAEPGGTPASSGILSPEAVTLTARSAGCASNVDTNIK